MVENKIMGKEKVLYRGYQMIFLEEAAKQVKDEFEIDLQDALKEQVNLELEKEKNTMKSKTELLLELYAKRLGIAKSKNERVDTELIATVLDSVVNYYNEKCIADLNAGKMSTAVPNKKKVLDIIATMLPTLLLDDKNKMCADLQHYVDEIKAEQTYLDINVYDMLVFKDDVGSIYQDCVCGTEKENIYGVKAVHCNNTTVFYSKEKFLLALCKNEDVLKTRGDLIEVWSRAADNQTYKRVWSK